MLSVEKCICPDCFVQWKEWGRQNSRERKKQGAVAPLSHRLDTLSRVEQPKQDWGGESAAHVRMTEASRHECIGGMRMHGGELKWYAPHAK